MCPVKHGSDCNREGFFTCPALPPAHLFAAFGVLADLVTMTIRALGFALPPDLFQVVCRLLIGLKRVEEFNDVHGFSVMVDVQVHFKKLITSWLDKIFDENFSHIMENIEIALTLIVGLFAIQTVGILFVVYAFFKSRK